MAFLGGTIDELITEPKEIVAFNLSLTIGDALDVMSHYEIFSAPVVDDGRCVGEVDYLDLLCALVRLTVEADGSALWPPSVAVRPDEIEHLTRRANDWTLREAFSRLERRPFFVAGPGEALREALAYMGAGTRHLLVAEPGTGRVRSLVSQSDMLRVLSEHLGELPVRHLTLAECGLGARPVHCVRNSDAALDAFFELGTSGYSGGAIVNEQGKLVGNLSRNDLKGVQGEGATDFGLLNQSIMHFQRKHRVALAQRLVTVTASTTLGEVVATMAKERVQRVFVVEQGMVPRGLVTQTDVCRVIADRLGGGAGVAAALGEHAAQKKGGKKKKKDADAPEPLTARRARQIQKQHAQQRLEFPLLFPPK